MSIEFCHIVPTRHLDLVAGRQVHLVLAHLVEEDQRYVDFYVQEKRNNPKVTIILDNSAFELYKRGLPMYPSERLVAMGKKVQADYIVMTDYPAEIGQKTIAKAIELAPVFKSAGFKTFFVPQSRIGDHKDLIEGFRWASKNPQLIDYVGVSILAAPNAYGVERGNKLQRFNARLRLMYAMQQQSIFMDMKHNGQRVHFLGMVDGPNEIMFHSPFANWIDTWDSSSACWAGFHDISYDDTPTGLRDGKFELEVDFNYHTYNQHLIDKAKSNMEYIDRLCYNYLWGTR